MPQISFGMILAGKIINKNLPMQYKNASWFSLAQSALETDRKHALKIALSNAEKFQEELLFWFFDADFCIQQQIYPFLNQEMQAYIEQEDTPTRLVPENLPKKHYLSDEEKNSWVQLAASEEDTNRKLALELLEAVAEKFQQEILYWLAYNPFNIKLKLFPLLLENKKKKFLLHHSKLPPFDKQKVFEIYETQESVLQKAILKHKAKCKDFWSQRVNFLLVYKDLTGEGLQSAIEAMNSIWDHPLGGK
jgi:hypothetical protein